jgi:hypothetical protein
MTPTTETAPLLWDDLEQILEASLAQVRAKVIPVPEIPRPIPTPISLSTATPQSTASETGSTGLSQLVAGCGVAAVDGYLAMREYAESKGVALIDFQRDGIDLQDLLSTLVIHVQREGEREAGARRWKR